MTEVRPPLLWPVSEGVWCLEPSGGKVGSRTHASWVVSPLQRVVAYGAQCRIAFTVGLPTKGELQLLQSVVSE